MPGKRKSSPAQLKARGMNISKAQKAAHAPEVRARAAATLRRRNAEKKENGIPLDMIPDPPTKPRKYKKKVKEGSSTRQEVVLALLKYLNNEE